MKCDAVAKLISNVWLYFFFLTDLTCAGNSVTEILETDATNGFPHRMLLKYIIVVSD